MNRWICCAVTGLLVLMFFAGSAGAESPWDLQAVDSNGEATHPKVGAPVEEANKVVVEGIALNYTGDYLNPSQMWQTYIQAESPDQGGIAAFSAIFYDNSQWPRYPMDVEAGDRVRVEGYAAFHRGKTNINERHSASPDLRFTVTKLEENVGLPAPQTIFDVSECKIFDESRTTGGEYYQNQWVELQYVSLQSGAWAPGENVVVEDVNGATMTMLLSDFGVFAATPSGAFHIRGIFDQEDETSPFTGDYRLWIRDESDVMNYLGGDAFWGLQAVDNSGNAIHPKAGAAVDPANKVVVEGIALNGPAEILNASQMWQVYVQAENDDLGGIAAFSAIFYDNSEWPRYPMDIEAGDRVRVEGYTAFHRGKVNINERHSASPDLRFTVTKIAEDAGMPQPQVIPSIASCNYFDPRRVGGGERYQAQWVKLEDVHIVAGTWAAGETLTISDTSGGTLSLLLSSEGDFDSYSVPAGDFTVVGIFDQEDEAAPFTDSYRLWVKKYSDIQLKTAVSDWEIYR